MVYDSRPFIMPTAIWGTNMTLLCFHPNLMNQFNRTVVHLNVATVSTSINP
jgi:hypothetical protein